ncbi:hypothetical protein H112_08345 [Trichophyton rubrum D6]|uniref:Uncharacterized protein n=2 Tax=Trichophyton TaxID=5550 RepID=A0A022VNZ0_TRIRU|nr:hypothetical protein H100_08367 [Trichophyton rubrum MR850]EZF37257.1 hypothetical protein H102_08327 [Trichophyton rubrum CBS 100081]EZF48012.1 hypothetical protein H103_08350 [Trichophyton rubrum CBS 288.86]EZF58631.1 hypothetical protein H104_08300 [Trichophyton rubrum CBS 289.86]EZF69212.1 hypothetical protein H105_08354 [Trichophyton soudanense CBS 452.61]EZF79837.1 hypothetical protein H110_08350 [Trichophyton rubrum MR1448]EZF90523.1 hypothetical protein H113_08418 [Trichophyton rub
MAGEEEASKQASAIGRCLLDGSRRRQRLADRDAAGITAKERSCQYSQLAALQPHSVTIARGRGRRPRDGDPSFVHPELPRPMEARDLTCGDTCKARSATSASAAAPAGVGVFATGAKVTGEASTSRVAFLVTF